MYKITKNQYTIIYLEPCKNQEGFDNQCRNWKQNYPNMCQDEFMKDRCKGECNEECGKLLNIILVVLKHRI